MQVLQTPTFKKQVKKLHKSQKVSVNAVINKIIQKPLMGIQKKATFKEYTFINFVCLMLWYC